MKRVADRYFRTKEPALALPGDHFLNNQLNHGENRSGWEESKDSTIPEDKDNKKDNLTATYWG